MPRSLTDLSVETLAGDVLIHGRCGVI